MADSQETFTAAEYSTWRKVNRIMAETGAEAQEQEDSKKVGRIDSTEDPAGAFAQRHSQLDQERNRKPSYTDEERKMMKSLANRFH